MWKSPHITKWRSWNTEQNAIVKWDFLLFCIGEGMSLFCFRRQNGPNIWSNKYIPLIPLRHIEILHTLIPLWMGPHSSWAISLWYPVPMCAGWYSSHTTKECSAHHLDVLQFNSIQLWQYLLRDNITFHRYTAQSHKTALQFWSQWQTHWACDQLVINHRFSQIPSWVQLIY